MKEVHHAYKTTIFESVTTPSVPLVFIQGHATEDDASGVVFYEYSVVAISFRRFHCWRSIEKHKLPPEFPFDPREAYDYGWEFEGEDIDNQFLYLDAGECRGLVDQEFMNEHTSFSWRVSVDAEAEVKKTKAVIIQDLKSKRQNERK